MSIVPTRIWSRSGQSPPVGRLLPAHEDVYRKLISREPKATAHRHRHVGRLLHQRAHGQRVDQPARSDAPGALMKPSAEDRLSLAAPSRNHEDVGQHITFTQLHLV